MSIRNMHNAPFLLSAVPLHNLLGLFAVREERMYIEIEGRVPCKPPVHRLATQTLILIQNFRTYILPRGTGEGAKGFIYHRVSPSCTCAMPRSSLAYEKSACEAVEEDPIRSDIFRNVVRVRIWGQELGLASEE